MTQFTVIDGPNFSGRSRLLGDILLDIPSTNRPFFLGPYAETGLSGFASTVRDELRFYGISDHPPPSPWAAWFAERPAQAISVLSGGEQVMLGLTCLSAQREISHVGIDCALEQLDEHNRTIALEFLSDLPGSPSISLIDHRLDHDHLVRARRLKCKVADNAFHLQIARAISEEIGSISAPTIRLDSLYFAYKLKHPIFDDCTIDLKPGTLYRLAGNNGSGKSTFLKLLCGVLRAQQGTIYLDGEVYEPYRSGNVLVAYATQNPDEQWTSTSLSNDFAMRLARIRERKAKPSAKHNSLALERLHRLARAMDIDRDRERHLLDYPRALRKRLSWIWPLSGLKPWLALDEPTLGQDIEAVSQLADALTNLARRGHGIIVISHDERLFQRLDYTVLRIEQRRFVFGH